MWTDADLEMAELARAGNAGGAAKRDGKCPHFSWVGYHPDFNESRNLRPGQVRCTDQCSSVFPTESALLQDSADVTAEYS